MSGKHHHHHLSIKKTTSLPFLPRESDKSKKKTNISNKQVVAGVGEGWEHKKTLARDVFSKTTPWKKIRESAWGKVEETLDCSVVRHT